MKIDTLECILLTGRWTDDPSFPQALHSTAFVRIGTDKGLEGLGEITLGYFTPESVPALVEYYQPVVVGKDPLQISALTRALYDDSVFWARTGAGRSVISGIELALWDLLGKTHDVPVCQLLGGAVRAEIPVYASGGPTCWPKEENLRKVGLYAQLGYRATKLSTGFYERVAMAENQAQGRMDRVKIHHSRLLEELVQNFELLRREFGSDMDFAIDGHEGAEPDPIPVSEAVAIAEALAPFRLRFYEEPLAYTNLEGYCELRKQSSLPIAGGESLAGMEQFHPFIHLGAVDLIQPDLGFVGGLAETVRLINHAEAHNIGAALHTGAAVGPALAASWQLAAACTSVTWLETVVAPRSIQQEFLVDPLEVKEGCIGLPCSPGLGVRLTPELRQKYRFIPGSGQRT